METGAVAGNLQFRILADLVYHIQAEALHTLVYPIAHNVIDLPADLGVFPVQIRLLGCKLVEIVLFQFRHIGPGGAAKHGPHIIGIVASVAVAPDVIVVIGVVTAFQRFPEPEMLIGAVVWYQIQDQRDTPVFGFPNECLHILHGAHGRINGPVVGHIVAVIHLGRLAYRRQPDAINAQFCQIVQPGNDAGQVAYTVAVGILEAFGVNLVENSVFPPAVFCFI